MEQSAKRIKTSLSVFIYLSAALWLALITQALIPWLSDQTGVEPIFFWFVCGGLGVFAPLIITGIVLLKYEGIPLSCQTFVNRLRFRRITRNDLVWCLTGLLAVLLLSFLILKTLEGILGHFETSPPFMSFATLEKGRYWLLIVWFPYWILNIMGEEFLWRGVLFPGEEISHGRYTWIFHGTGWGIFHLAFGWKLLVTLLPLLYIQSYVVQKTQNSWTGVIMHGALNGPSFIAIALGFI